MNNKTFLELLKNKKKIIIIVGVLLSIVLICVLPAIIEAIELEIEIQRLDEVAEMRKPQVEELIEEFKEIYPLVEFEIEYRTLAYRNDEYITSYYIKCEGVNEEFFQYIIGNNAYSGMGTLLREGVSEHIYVHVNDEFAVEIDTRYNTHEINWDWVYQ